MRVSQPTGTACAVQASVTPPAPSAPPVAAGLSGSTWPAPWVPRPGLDMCGLHWTAPVHRENGLPADVPVVPVITSLIARNLEHMLSGHPNRALAAYVVAGATDGFRLNSDLEIERHATTPPNMPSAVSHPEVIRAWLEAELDAGRVIGPLDALPKGCMACPLGTVPKSKRSATPAFRMINNFSAEETNPTGQSVNSCIDKSEHGLVYMSVLDMAAAVRRYGRSAFVAKVDIRNAFRNLATHTSSHRYAFLTVDGQLFLDVAVNFGSRASPFVFNSVASAIHWVVQQRCDAALGAGAVSVFHLLDDFGLCGKDFAATSTAYRILLDTLSEAGLPFAPEKCFPPCKRLEFLGVMICVAQQVLFLPADKVSDNRRCIARLAAQGVRPLLTKQLKSITGKLQFASFACLQMRPMLSELYKASSHTRRFTRLPREARSDLQLWDETLEKVDTQTPIEHFFAAPQRPFSSTWCGDAAGRQGYGAWCRDGEHDVMFYQPWPDLAWTMDETEERGSSTAQELVPLVLIVLSFLAPGRSIRYETDSADLVFALRKGRSSAPRVNALVRLILARAAETGADVQAVWHPRDSANQKFADLLSRGLVQEFRASSGSDPSVFKIPDSTLTRVFRCA